MERRSIRLDPIHQLFSEWMMGRLQAFRSCLPTVTGKVRTPPINIVISVWISLADPSFRWWWWSFHSPDGFRTGELLPHRRSRPLNRIGLCCGGIESTWFQGGGEKSGSDGGD